MSLEILVENIKCGGCANSIRKQLLDLDGVEQVDVDVAEGKVHVVTYGEEDEASLCERVLQQLHKMGYPQVGSVDGLRAKGAKAKSFVSCAVGKLTD
ncbi:heavy metal-associated domain-containing protein [Thiomicrorhabdus sp. ZW0627]|uniref:heavy-metal-associated domain-containing protein n=1 Tax=Thiomicrorhabdus sp. ZW0627 TaxID=3039774 RepID=UPI0024369854|nr:heavy metal-associated domain-containing protein [Thiomicrorhabdus sp. ZW0627]MDG6774794.1 heavy metal-associated domain-containing protein [Thiomicrorhabdus sp. ZW0627]